MGPEPVGRAAQAADRARPGPRAVPEAVWSPLAAGLLVLAPGLAGLALGKPVLFASLGPTAFLIAAQPQLPSARASNVVLGHLVGFAVGVGAVLLLGAGDLPSAFVAKKLVPPRMWASVLAAVVTMLLTSPTRAGFHPPAVATALLVTAGGFQPNWADAQAVALGVAVTAAVGEVLRRLRLAQPGQS